MKRNFTLLMAAFALIVSMMMPLGMKGENYVVRFNSTTTNNDGTQQLNSVSDIVASGASYISSISDATRVYKGKSGYGVKLGSTSGAGYFTMNLSSSGKVYANSITFNACYFGTDNSYLYVTINGDEDGEKYFALSSSLSNVTYTFSAPTLVSSIKISGSAKNRRFYVASMTVNYSDGVQTVATPAFSLAGGTYTGTQNVAISCATSGATIRYTTDGTTPTSSSSIYSSPIAITHTTTLKAFAMKSGMVNSEVTSATYTIESSGDQPTNSYVIDFENALSTYSDWTFDNIGTSNTAITAHGGSKYGSNINASGNGVTTCSITTNSAIAYPQSLTCYLSKCSTNITGSTWFVKVRSANSYTWTTVDTHSASSMSKGEWVEFTVDLSVYENVYVQISYSSSSAIRAIDDITLSATDPTSPVINVSNVNDLAYSDLSGSFNFSVTNPVPNVNVNASVASGSDWISNVVADNANGTVSFATTKNTTATDRTGSIKLSYTGAADNYVTISQGHLSVAAPTFSPVGGDYTTPQEVTISAEQGSTIYYTINEDNPTTSSTVYSSPIQVTCYSVIKAIAVQDGVSSPVATATYNIPPVLHTTHTPASPFPYTGGSGSFNFSVTNPVTGATVSTVADNWITPTVSDGVVNFQVGENHGGARSGNITLNYVSNGNTLATTTVSISQEANPDQPGSEANPYTVTQAIENTPNSGTSDFVYVTGIVSKIYEIEVFQYHNAKYVITVDGNYSSSADTVMAYRGKYFYGQDFISEDQLQLGDEVVVYGKLTKYHNGSELAADNYIVSLNRAVQPVTFNPSSCVTVSCDVYLFTNSLYEGWDAQIFYTTDGRDPIEYGTLFENPWDESLSVTQTTTIKAVAYIPDLGKWSAVTEATYTIVDPESPGWHDNPYTVSQACEALATNSNIKGAYVQGVVSSITQIETTQYHNATYFIIDEGQATPQLQVYRGKYIARADFVSEDQLLPGDQVVVFGDLAIYNGTKEFKGGNYIVNWSRSTSILVSPSQYEFNSNAISDFNINVHYSDDLLVNVNNPTLQLCDAEGNEVSSTTYEWLQVSLSQTNDWDLMCDIDANTSDQARTAYLKVLYQDQNGNNIESNLITITQNEYRPDFAELPFEFNGGRDAIEGVDGLTQNNLGEDYSSTTAPTTKLKFESKTENGVVNVSSLVLKINEAPGILSYNIKANSSGGAWSGTFKVQASADGLSWNDMYEYNGSNLNATVRQDTINNLPPTTRYIRWIYVTKSNGNVGLGNIKLTKAPCVIEIVQPTIDGTQVGTIYTNAQEAVEGVTVGMSINYQPTDYYFVEWVVTDADGNPVTVDNPTAITAYFTMPSTSVTVTATMVIPNTPCTYAYSVNGVVGETTTASVGEQIQQMPSSSNIVVNDQTFNFRGWTTDANNVTNLILPGSSFTLRQDVTFYAVYLQQVPGLVAEKHYAKVTRELSDWSGDYLIVYETGNVAFNGGLETLDAANNTVAVTISNGIINATETINAAKFTIAAVEGGYSIKSASGKYIGRDASSNGLNENTTIQYVNTISYAPSGVIEIQGASGAYLKYNTSSGNTRFRYYMSGQKDIQLYKYVGSVSNLYTRIFMNETANSVTIEGPSIIPNGSVLEVTTITNNVSADRLLVDEGGQLVTSSNVNATARKSITPYQQQQGNDNYYLIASPVNNLNPATAGMTSANFDLYAFDQSAQGEEWQNYKADDFNLAAGQGYLYANDYGGFINMGGTMAANASAVTITNVSGKPFAGWNLIGNPYPCNVTIDKPFYRLAEGGAALATVATDNSVAIAPMEGVFVCADGMETVSFTKAPTTSTTDGRNLLSMRVSRNRSSKDDRVETDNAIVRFGEGAMLRKLVLNPDLSQLYVAQEGTDYAIVNAEAEGELPVSFRAAANGSYTFSVAAEGVTMRYLHLIDHKTGADVDLLQTPSYTFEASTGDFESRFKLVFACGDTNDGSETFAYYNGSQWMVSNEGANATLQVVDVMGRVLSSQSINDNAEISLGYAPGVYVIRLINGNEVKSQKIVIE